MANPHSDMPMIDGLQYGDYIVRKYVLTGDQQDSNDTDQKRVVPEPSDQLLRTRAELLVSIPSNNGL